MILAAVVITLMIAIPNLLKSKTMPGRCVAVHWLHHIYIAQKRHFTEHGRYGILRELREAGLIDERAAPGMGSGYLWEIRSYGSDRWSVVAWPQEPGETGSRSFYIDQTGILRWAQCESKNDPLANKNSKPIEDFNEIPESWAR